MNYTVTSAQDGSKRPTNSAWPSELSRNGITCQLQLGLPVPYKDGRLDCEYRIDILVEDQRIVELKSVEVIKDIHEAQLLTYVKLAGMKIGLRMTFNVTKLQDGIKRFVF